MYKIIGLFLLATSLQGCSFLVDLAFFNNTDTPVEVCNLNLTTPKCQTVQAKSLEKITLVADKQVFAWTYSISQGSKKGVYEFEFGQYPEHASEVYCHGLFMRVCDIPVQYEKNGMLYWGGKNNELPVQVYPEQPEGFPVKPSA